ncbi:MAG: sulfite exporter TauE/SafE family protein [Candidatus Roizmanbacteria bacterium]
MKQFIFHVSGTHCPSCKILIEDILGRQDGIVSAHVDLKKEIVEVVTTNDERAIDLAATLSGSISKNGYTLSLQKTTNNTTHKKDMWMAVPLGFALLGLFFILQRSGILNFGIGGPIRPMTSFIIGLIASVSSCLAVVGGLVLSLSAKVSQEKTSTYKNFFFFHTGRIVSFALLGGVLGAVGGLFRINYTLSTLLGLVAAIVMIMLGLDLSGVLPKKNITLPTGAFRFFQKIEHTALTPFILGFGTFFLPCGFTQSMQVAALSSGSFISGLLIMLAFVMGTFPMLSALSFGSSTIAHSKYAPLFYKTVGIVVIGFGVLGALTALAALGIINPLVSF